MQVNGVTSNCNTTSLYVMLATVVAVLPDDQRLAVVLRFFLDLSYADIEAATGWPSGTVKSRLNRGLAHLHKQLSERSLGCDL